MQPGEHKKHLKNHTDAHLSFLGKLSPLSHCSINNHIISNSYQNHIKSPDLSRWFCSKDRSYDTMKGQIRHQTKPG